MRADVVDLPCLGVHLPYEGAVEVIHQGLIALHQSFCAQASLISGRLFNFGLGARLLQNTCEELQLATRYHKLDESRRLAPMLTERFAEAETALRKLLASYQG